MSRMGYLSAFLAVIAGAGCARVADMVPLNDAAVALGVPKMDATLYGTGYGPVTVLMPSGEVLQGHYRLALGGSTSNGIVTVATPRGSSVATATAVSTPMNGPFTVQATGPRGTTMVCQGSAGGMGHSDAVCTLNGGAQYQMMF